MSLAMFGRTGRWYTALLHNYPGGNLLHLDLVQFLHVSRTPVIFAISSHVLRSDRWVSRLNGRQMLVSSFPSFLLSLFPPFLDPFSTASLFLIHSVYDLPLSPHS